MTDLESSFCYRLFGFTVATNQALPIFGRGLEPRTSTPDIWVELQEVEGRLGEWGSGFEPAPDKFRIWYQTPDTFVECEVAADGHRISVFLEGAFDLTNVGLLLSGVIVKYASRLMGRVGLHASVVALQGRAFGFLGPKGAGKSTTAALFRQEGFDVLSDDLLLLSMDGREGFLVESGPSELRLWDDALDILKAERRHEHGAIYRTGKKHIPLDCPTQSSRAKLAGLYILTTDSASSTSVSPPLPAIRAVQMLMANRTGLNLPFEAGREKSELGFLSQLVAQVPVRLLFNKSCTESLVKVVQENQ